MKPCAARFLKVAAAGLLFGCGFASPRESSRDPPGRALAPADSIANIADSLYTAGSYADAKVAWSAALPLSAGDAAAEARILTSLGLTEWRLGDYVAARERTGAARALLETNGLDVHLPRTLNAIGLIAWDQGRLSEAADLWRRTIAIAQKVGDQEYVAKPAMNLGLWYAGIGELESARESFAASLVTGRKLEIRPLELRSLVNLAMIANRMGDPRGALAWLDSATKAGVTDDFLAEDNYRSQLAVAARMLGDPAVAFAGLESAIRVARLAGLRQSEAANLTLLADVYWEAGDPHRALGLNAGAEAIHAELELPSEQGQNLHSSALIHAALGHTDRAREFALRALMLHQTAEDPLHEFDDRLLLAELGDTAQLAGARRLAASLATRRARADLGLAEARIAASSGRSRQVLRALTSISRDLEHGLSPEIAESEALRAHAYLSLKQWDSTVAAGRRGLNALERIRGGYGSGVLRASFAAFHAGIYGDVVSALLARDRIEEAFQIADAARSELARSAATTRRSVNMRHVHQRDPDLLRRISSLEESIRASEEDGTDVPELRDRLQRAQREYELSVLSAGDGASGHTERGSLQRVRQRLAPDEAMLAYLVTPLRLFIFSVTRQETRVRVVSVSAADLEARVRLARQTVADPNRRLDEAGAVFAALGTWLASDAEIRDASVRRLVVVPHGILAYLPFAALLMSDGKYLIERYSLVHLPSASFVTRVAGSAPRPMTRMAALAPLPRELPATALEVSAVGRANVRARVLVGRRAGESALRKALSAGGPVHVASHGVVNGLNPLFSRIELAPGRKGDAADDGRLEVHEVLGMQIRSPLVFLSGCETALGPGGSRRYAPGEDYATLAAAFLNAGAKQVVSTLWAIPDTGAAVFATEFYRGLHGTDAGEALAGAQRSLLRQARFRHPYFWASYRLAG